MLNDYIYIHICLSDISASQLFTSTETGKTYVNLKIAKRKSPDRYGNTVSVEVYRPTNKFTDDGKAKKPLYVGAGRDFFPNKKK